MSNCSWRFSLLLWAIFPAYIYTILFSNGGTKRWKKVVNLIHSPPDIIKIGSNYHNDLHCENCVLVRKNNCNLLSFPRLQAAPCWETQVAAFRRCAETELTVMEAIHYASWRALCRAARILSHASWSTTTYTMLHTPYYYWSVIVQTTSPF